MILRVAGSIPRMIKLQAKWRMEFAEEIQNSTGALGVA